MKKDKTALISAADIIARQEQSEGRLRHKLSLRKYSDEEIDKAVQTLKERKYLDDEASCRRRFNQMYEAGKLSVRQICAKLLKAGYKIELIESCILNDNEEHEQAVALRMLRSKFKFADTKKMWRYLSTKGFSSEIMYAAIREFGGKIDE